MSLKKTTGWFLFLVLASALVETAAGVLTPVTLFAYQGRLNDGGVPANGV